MRDALQCDPTVHSIDCEGKMKCFVADDIDAINETLRQRTIAAVESDRQDEAQQTDRG